MFEDKNIPIKPVSTHTEYEPSLPPGRAADLDPDGISRESPAPQEYPEREFPSVETYSKKLETELPLAQRTKLLELVRSVTNESTPPEGFTEVTPTNTALNFEKSLLDQLTDPTTRFSSKLYRTEDGDFVLALPGSKSLKDLQNNLSILTGDETPAQVESALKAYKAASQIAEMNGGQLTVVGFSLGGYLAQLFPSSVNFSGPGAGSVYNELVSNGTYEKFGIPHEGSRIHIGSHNDPVYNLVDTDRNLDRKLDNPLTPTSPHVISSTGAGGVFYLSPTGDQNGLIQTDEHFKNWESLANNPTVVRVDDTTYNFEAAMRHTIPWLSDSPLTDEENQKFPAIKISF